MDSKHASHKKKDKKRRQDRYWSLMLVGEHGRVVPFNRFKEVAIGIAGVILMLMIISLISVFLYVRQATTLSDLRRELSQLGEQNAKLRDEKDLLLAELVIYKNMADATGVREHGQPKGIPGASAEKGEVEKVPPAAKSSADVTTPDSPLPPRDSEPRLKISGFSASYESAKTQLLVKLRLENSHGDKLPFAGRTAVLLWNLEDPTVQRITLPRVNLVEGKPSPKQGQAFTIGSPRTIEFKLWGPKLPIPYNRAAIYVFSSAGEQVLVQELTLDVEYIQPPPNPIGKPDATPKPAAPHRPANKPAATEIVSEPEVKATPDGGAPSDAPPQ